ncbi:MAG: hypothetical protein ABIZ30_01415 [Candidatus Limnocylindrales bacterium]
MADRLPREAGRHESHDSELVARFVAGDATTTEISEAQRWVDTCPECVALASDLRAIMSATQEMRTLAGARAPAAPRDFRITPGDAARLRRRGPWQIFGTVRTSGALRWLGGAFATLGIVGLLVSAGLPALLGGAGSAASSGSAEAPQDAATFGAMAPAGPTATADLRLQVKATGDPQADTEAGAEATAAGEPAGAPRVGALSSQATAALGSLAALVLGLALLLASRRRSHSGT